MLIRLLLDFAPTFSLRSRRQECDDSTGKCHRSDVVDGGAEASEDVERGEDEESQEHGVVEEDGVSGRLVLGDLKVTIVISYNMQQDRFMHLEQKNWFSVTDFYKCSALSRTSRFVLKRTAV